MSQQDQDPNGQPQSGISDDSSDFDPRELQMSPPPIMSPGSTSPDTSISTDDEDEGSGMNGSGIVQEHNPATDSNMGSNQWNANGHLNPLNSPDMGRIYTDEELVMTPIELSPESSRVVSSSAGDGSEQDGSSQVEPRVDEDGFIIPPPRPASGAREGSSQEDQKEDDDGFIIPPPRPASGIPTRQTWRESSAFGVLDRSRVGSNTRGGEDKSNRTGSDNMEDMDSENSPPRPPISPGRQNFRNSRMSMSPPRATSSASSSEPSSPSNRNSSTLSSLSNRNSVVQIDIFQDPANIRLRVADGENLHQESEEVSRIDIDPAMAERIRELLKQKGLEGLDSAFSTHPIPAVLHARQYGEILSKNDMEKSRGDGDGQPRRFTRNRRRMSRLNPHYEPNSSHESEDEDEGQSETEKSSSDTEHEDRPDSKNEATGPLHDRKSSSSQPLNHKTALPLALARAKLYMENPELPKTPLTHTQIENQYYTLLQVKTELDKKMERVASLESEKDELEQELAEANQRVERFKGQVSQHTVQRLALERDLQEFKDKAEALDNCNARTQELESKIAKLEQEHDELVDQQHWNEFFTHQIADYRSQIAALEKEKSRLEKELSETQAELHALQSNQNDPAKPKNVLTALRQNLLPTAATEKEKKLVSLLKEAQAESRYLQTKLSEKESEIHALQSQSSSLKSKLSTSLQESQSNLESRCKDLETSLLEKQTLYESLVQDHETTKQQLEKQSATHAKQAQLCQDLEDQIKKLTSVYLKEHSETQRRLEDYQRRAEDFENLYKDLQTQYSALESGCTATVSELRRQLAEKQQQETAVPERPEPPRTPSVDSVWSQDKSTSSSEAGNGEGKEDGDVIRDLRAQIEALTRQKNALMHTLSTHFHNNYHPYQTDPNGYELIPAPVPYNTSRPHSSSHSRTPRKRIPLYETQAETSARQRRMALLRVPLSTALKAVMNEDQVIGWAREACWRREVQRGVLSRMPDDGWIRRERGMGRRWEVHNFRRERDREDWESEVEDEREGDNGEDRNNGRNLKGYWVVVRGGEGARCRAPRRTNSGV